MLSLNFHAYCGTTKLTNKRKIKDLNVSLINLFDLDYIDCVMVHRSIQSLHMYNDDIKLIVLLFLGINRNNNHTLLTHLPYCSSWKISVKYCTTILLMSQFFFCSALLGGAIVAEKSIKTIWKMNNSGVYYFEPYDFPFR